MVNEVVAKKEKCREYWGRGAYTSFVMRPKSELVSDFVIFNPNAT